MSEQARMTLLIIISLTRLEEQMKGKPKKLYISTNDAEEKKHTNKKFTEENHCVTSEV